MPPVNRDVLGQALPGPAIIHVQIPEGTHATGTAFGAAGKGGDIGCQAIVHLITSDEVELSTAIEGTRMIIEGCHAIADHLTSVLATLEAQRERAGQGAAGEASS